MGYQQDEKQKVLVGPSFAVNQNSNLGVDPDLGRHVSGGSTSPGHRGAFLDRIDDHDRDDAREP